MHVGIILDGNRRYAKKYLKNPFKGHEKGADVVDNLLGWSSDLGIKELSLYCFSTENFKRKKEEVDYLMRLFKKWFARMRKDSKLKDNQINVKFIGRKHLFSEEIQELMISMEEETKDHNNFKVNFCMGYGGRAEILDSTRLIAQKVKDGELQPEDINEEIFKQHLYLNSDPDLVIRTSGEQRLSNFLTFQSSYSELLFIDKLWPEFTKEDLEMALEEFSSRQRRRGK